MCRTSTAAGTVLRAAVWTRTRWPASFPAAQLPARSLSRAMNTRSYKNITDLHSSMILTGGVLCSIFSRPPQCAAFRLSLIHISRQYTLHSSWMVLASALAAKPSAARHAQFPPSLPGVFRCASAPRPSQSYMGMMARSATDPVSYTHLASTPFVLLVAELQGLVDRQGAFLPVNSLSLIHL